MGYFDYISKEIKERQNDSSYFRCPICGENNNLGNNECANCGYDLKEYKILYYFYFNSFNKAVELIQSNRYIEALEEITKYLINFPNDKEAHQLRIYLYSKLNLNYDLLLDQYIEKFSIDEFVKIAEESNDFEIKVNKKEFEVNNKIDNVISFLNSQINNEKVKNITNWIQLINSFYNLKENLSLTIKNKKIRSEINAKLNYFYENLVISNANEIGLSIQDFANLNYLELLENKTIEPDEIGKIFKTYKKKRNDGDILSVQFPLIKYHGKVIQKISFTCSFKEEK